MIEREIFPSNILMIFLACPSFWDLSGNSCCWFRPMVMKRWDDAHKDCQNRGGYLVKIDNEEEHKFITDKQTSLPVILTGYILIFLVPIKSIKSKL